MDSLIILDLREMKRNGDDDGSKMLLPGWVSIKILYICEGIQSEQLTSNLL
jgi:hypothetical protein